MRFAPYILFLLLILAALPTIGQNCGCADDENCPSSISSNSSTTICYSIEDAFNDNLANPTQGVCGVSVYFEHDQIGALDMTLTSPNGTQVQLTGTTGNCNNWTLISSWNIVFLPCSEGCFPDTINGCALPCVFDNCPVDCNWPNAFMTGAYLPYNGCLEDFNSGPVNGQWCLEIDNGAQFQGGTIFDFEVLLCDQSGFSCCDADAGNLAFEPNVFACEGDEALLLTPNPMYGAVTPDENIYGYAYTVFSNGSLLALDSLTDFRAYLMGTYQICGLSYLLEDSLQLPAIGSPLSAVDIYNNLYGPAPDFCGDIDTNCFIVHISEPPPLANITDTLCFGGTFLIGSTAYNETGFYMDTISSVGGCDSIVHLDLTVLKPDTTEIVAVICEGEEYVVGTEVFSETTIDSVLLENQFGCDSLVILDLTVLLPVEVNLAEMLCLGDTFWIGNIPHFETGIYADTLLTIGTNCDSIVNLDLTIVEVTVSIDDTGTLTCTNTEETLISNAATTMGPLSYEWTTDVGQFNSPFDQPNVGVNEPGMYYLTVQASGCSAIDSVFVEENTDAPTAIALSNEPDKLTCTVLSVQLNGSTSIGGPNLGYLWTGDVSDPNSPTPIVDEPGVYELTVTDLDNGCTGTDQIEIFEDVEVPIADAGVNDSLSCLNPTITLDGSASTPIGNISFAWEGVGGGNFITPTNIPNPQVNEPGAYQLTVTNLFNGCTDTDLVGISNDQTRPIAVIEIIGTNIFNCVNDSVFLDGSNSQNLQNVTYKWIGNIAEGQGTLTAVVTSPGVYSLALLNTVTGCADTATVTIGNNYTTPVADAGIGPDAITCTDSTESIGGNGTSFGNFIYQWTSSPSGAFISGTDQDRFAKVTAPGTYYLTVTHVISGCTAIDSVVVDDGLEPLEAVVISDSLTCDQQTVELDASASVIPPGANFVWQNTSGNVLAGGQLFYQVDSPDSLVFIVSLGACRDTALAVVSGIESLPMADAGPDNFIDCNTAQATLNGINSDTGNGFGLFWTPIQGVVLSGETTTFPLVQGVGIYQLAVTDMQTGCTTFDTVQTLLDSIVCRPEVDAGADVIVGCSPSFINLQATGSVGQNFSYQWTMLPDSVLSYNGFYPLVSAGTYAFCVTNDLIGLTACDTVEVVPDTVAPVASIDPLLLALNCSELTSCYPLDVTGTSQGNNYIYEWASLDGSFCTPVDILNVEIQGTGTYEVVVTDQTNGCSATDNIEVILADFPVNANIVANVVEMECGATDTTITAIVSSLSTDLSYMWSSPTGQILGGQNALTATVAPIGASSVFYFTVTNNNNQCTARDSVVVFAPVNCEPTCAASVSGPIDCNNETVVLSAAGSSAAGDISYLWTALTGNLCGGETTDMACADQAGIYRLAVSRTYPNGAVFTSTCDVSVMDKSGPPDVEAGENDDLNCIDETLHLNGTGSATGLDFIYFWETQSGNIVNGETTLSPEVDAVGMYYLTVTDTSTGCSNIDSVEIGIDTQNPNAEAGPDQLITCVSSSVTLDGSTTLANALFSWTTNNGDLCSNPNMEDVSACSSGTYYLTVTNPINGCSATDSVDVGKDNDVPEVNVGDDLYYTCADTVFTIQAVVVSQGSGILEFQWTTTNGCFDSPTDILQPTVSCPGQYELSVTDLVNNCRDSAVVIVYDETTPPIADAGETAEINCDNFTIELNGGNSTPIGELDFLWATMDGQVISNEMTATVDSAGEYQLLVTDQFSQCTDLDIVTITIDNGIPNVEAGADTSLTCTRLELSLNGNGSETGTNILYQWNGPGILSGANTLQPLINLSGLYELEVRDTSNGCVVTDEVMVLLDTISPVAIIDSSQPLLVTCEIKNLPLSGANSTPAGNVGFAWTTDDGTIAGGVSNQTVTVSSGGTYTLTVTDLANGCTDQASIQVQEDLEKPFLQVFPPDQLTCERDSVQLEALAPTNQPIFTFQWAGPGNILNEDTRTPIVFETGVFWVTMTDTTNGCTSDTSVVVTRDISPPTAVATAMGILDCDNLSAFVSGEGSSTDSITYTWTTNSGGNISTPFSINAEVDKAGTYVLTVTKLSNGCEASDTVIVQASSTPIDSVHLSLAHPDCIELEGFIYIDSVFGGTPPYTYSLNDSISVTYPQFSYLDPGSYDLAVEGKNGCSWETKISILLPNDVLVELGDDIFIRQGESADLEALVNISLDEISDIVWSSLLDTVDCDTCLEQVVSPTETTIYHVQVFDSTGCWGEDAITVFVSEENPFFVPSAFTPNSDNTNDRLIFYAGKDIQNVPEFSIYDRWGNRVFHQENFQPNNPNYGWDGKFEGLMMRPAVFVWKAIVELLDGKRKVYYGEVTLIR